MSDVQAYSKPSTFDRIEAFKNTLVSAATGDLAAVQRIMRHQDPRITTEVYGTSRRPT